jgi:hypothetical protein
MERGVEKRGKENEALVVVRRRPLSLSLFSLSTLFLFFL